MLYIKKFNNIENFESYKNSIHYIRPNVSLINNNRQLSYEQRYKKLEYIDNPNVNLNYQMYINKNFHFISTHEYRIECKLHFVNHYDTTNVDQCPILTLSKFVESEYVYGYMIYWHKSDNIYELSESYLSPSFITYIGPSTDIIITNTIISGLTNEFYLTLYGNIRAYWPSFTNCKIYYVKITDVTTNTLICHLIPKIDANENIKYLLDLTDNTKYYLQTLGNRYREQSELTIYPNEIET